MTQLPFNKDSTFSASWFRHYGFKAWFWRPLSPALTAAPRELRKQNWQRIEPDQIHLLDCLLGLLADVRQRGNEYWVQADELAFVELYPAGLGFPLEEDLERLLPSNLLVPKVLNPFPPIRLGQVGAVLVDHQYREYSSAQLPQDAQEHLQQLETALRALQDDPGEPLSEYLLICSVPSLLKIYQDRLHTEQQALLAQLPIGERLRGWLATRRFTPGHTTPSIEFQKVEQKIALLQDASRHLDRLLQPSEQVLARYDQLWPEIRQHVRSLAVAYARLEQPRMRSMPVIRGYNPEVPLSAQTWLKKEHRTAILADPFSQALIRGLRDGKAFLWDETRQCACLQLSLQPPSGSAEMELCLVPSSSPDPLTQVEKWRKLLKDHLVDTWLALQILILVLSPDDLAASIPINPADLLEVCLREKSHYAYTAPQYKLIADEIELLAHLHLRLTVHLPHRQSTAKMINPLVTLHRDHARDHAEIALGNWVTAIPTQWRKTATMTRRLLKVHPDVELRAKRLGLELTFQLSGYAQGSDFEMEELHKLAGIYVDDANPKRSRDGMMRAMKLLVGLPVLEQAKKKRNHDEPFILDSRKYHSTLAPEDQIIGGFWALGNHEQLELVEQKHWGWFPAWRTLHWHFLPAPEPVRMSPEQQ